MSTTRQPRTPANTSLRTNRRADSADMYVRVAKQVTADRTRLVPCCDEPNVEGLVDCLNLIGHASVCTLPSANSAFHGARRL
jgi:hypothetical protein